MRTEVNGPLNARGDEVAVAVGAKQERVVDADTAGHDRAAHDGADARYVVRLVNAIDKITPIDKAMLFLIIITHRISQGLSLRRSHCKRGGMAFRNY